MIYRIAEQTDWQNAQQTGAFASADLTREGFIHASEQAQIMRTANKYYRGKNDLVLLEINEQAPGMTVKREDLAGTGIFFPHVYAPIPLAAIARAIDFPEDAAGGFSLPAAL